MSQHRPDFALLLPAVVLLGFFPQASSLSSKGTRDLEVGEFRLIRLQSKRGHCLFYLVVDPGNWDTMIWCRVTRYPRVFHRLMNDQWTPGFWGVTQTLIATSTMESEFIALEFAGKEVKWLRNFLSGIPL